MARYIDADKIHYPVDKRETGKTDWHRGVLYMKDTIDRQPTADVAEVKHGKWILEDHGQGTCNKCGFTQKDVWDMTGWQNYCGHCGAKMDGGKI